MQILVDKPAQPRYDEIANAPFPLWPMHPARRCPVEQSAGHRYVGDEHKQNIPIDSFAIDVYGRCIEGAFNA